MKILVVLISLLSCNAALGATWRVSVKKLDGEVIENKVINGSSNQKLYLPKTPWICMVTPTNYSRIENNISYETRSITCKYGKSEAIATTSLSYSKRENNENSVALRVADIKNLYIIRLHAINENKI